MTESTEDNRGAAWREWAKADAERRGLAQLVPLIDGLSTIIATLRAADWNHDATGRQRAER